MKACDIWRPFLRVSPSVLKITKCPCLVVFDGPLSYKTKKKLKTGKPVFLKIIGFSPDTKTDTIFGIYGIENPKKQDIYRIFDVSKNPVYTKDSKIDVDTLKLFTVRFKNFWYENFGHLLKTLDILEIHVFDPGLKTFDIFSNELGFKNFQDFFDVFIYSSV